MNNCAHELVETELDRVCGGELHMIRLQSLISQRQMAIQLTTNMLRAMNDSTRTIAGNIGK
ncbi:hypothetical protein [Bradyrhizobium sp. JYMT SZCCT0428]|uniref:hypothetical protein n=1 Tax=Bradyrhizobium sp. JYMT SZCCT0428 TaxID=2807673 RepID=UPI001BA987F0|nr:hypothetical protein [Bradyrhizobium sp. JYMT SZCCT0428]MBR1151067.1 hypothetical protein [Bradyrhizobium sp. JYMT SZCCT0428]